MDGGVPRHKLRSWHVQTGRGHRNNMSRTPIVQRKSEAQEKAGALAKSVVGEDSGTWVLSTQDSATPHPQISKRDTWNPEIHL